MFLCPPLLDVLIGRGIEDIDSFIQLPSWSDLPDPLSIPGMAQAVDRVLGAARQKQRITAFGDYDCDGVLGAYILRTVVASWLFCGTQACLRSPHLDASLVTGLAP